MKWRDALNVVMGQIRREAAPMEAPAEPEPATVAFTPVTEGEVQSAVAALYGRKDGTRKRQRKRHGVTYRQRDQIAHLLLRMWHNREETNDGH